MDSFPLLLVNCSLSKITALLSHFLKHCLSILNSFLFVVVVLSCFQFSSFFKSSPINGSMLSHLQVIESPWLAQSAHTMEGVLWYQAAQASGVLGRARLADGEK